MKKQTLLSLILTLFIVAALLSLGSMSAPAADFSGDGWSYDENNRTLTITSDSGTTEWRSDGNGDTIESNVVTVIISKGVTSIGEGAFSDCGALANIIIPNTVTSIESAAFATCTSLWSITIPESVTSIRENAFSGTRLNSVYFNGNYNIEMQPGIDDIDGGTKKYRNPEATGWSLEYIPAFGITNNLKNITNSGFNGIEVDENNNATTDFSATLIAVEGFYIPYTISITVGGTELATADYTYDISETGNNGKITIPKDNITGNIEITAVAVTIDELIEINVDGQTEIGYDLSDALIGFTLTAITDLQITDGTFTTDDWNYLSNLTALKRLVIQSGAYSVAAMPNTISTEPIFPATIETVELNHVERIGDYAFYRCTNLGTVRAPDLTTVGNYSFYNCDALHSITYGKAITSIGDFAFYDCDSINRSFSDPTDPYSGSSLSLPIGLTSVGESAFERTAETGGGLMTEIIMPEIESIGANAFKGRDALADIKMGVTPPTTVGTGAFFGISASAVITPVGADGNVLDTAAYDAAITAYKAANDGDTADNLFYGVALKARTALIKYVDTSGATHFIENENLADLDDYDLDFSKVAELEILSGTFATADWNRLKAVLNKAVYTKFVIHDAVTSVADILNTTINDPIFPTTIEEVTVHNMAKIGEAAFYEAENLTTVNFPDVVEVGYGALCYTKLTELTASSFPKLETIGNLSFANITTLTAVNLPSAETLAQNAFLGSQNISTIALPKVTSLGGRVFNSGNITSLTLPGAPPTIGGSNPFDGQGKDAVIIAFVAANGTALTGADLTAAISAYEQANDIETYNLWYGWRIKQPADVNSDGTIDIDDLEAIASSAYYNSKTTTGTQTFDVNGDDKINFADLAMVRNSKNFGK